MPLTQGAKVFLGAGGLIALYSLSRSRRHHAEARAEYQAYAGNPYAPVYPPEPSRATALKEVVKQHGGAAIKDATHAAGEVAEVLITHGKVGRGAPKGTKKEGETCARTPQTQQAGDAPSLPSDPSRPQSPSPWRAP
jgi:hypothetical protein